MTTTRIDPTPVLAIVDMFVEKVLDAANDGGVAARLYAEQGCTYQLSMKRGGPLLLVFLTPDGQQVGDSLLFEPRTPVPPAVREAFEENSA